MPVQVHIEFPNENAVTLSPKFLAESRGVVTIKGRGNTIEIGEPFLPNAAHFTLTGGATIRVRPSSNLNRLHVHALAEEVSINIGEWASFNGSSQIMAHERSSIVIGTRCLFGDGCVVTSSDVHKILDNRTGERLNPARDIIVGDHVWIAPRVNLLRGATIGADSVVGTGAVVTGAFPPNVSIAGTPARIIREGITWEL
ncbi:acyltransferase [Methylobacterium sp. WL103]|uniref:acyltransferase n=1 Tax=Methylobacterium sp. WL103 TaxID=2603891 RepID=UPI0011C8F762|nr:acyltransferase [Methylobacterium sp. WL103]TXN03425.1 acyltransferase [Methylobacterium sp. WL103]